MGQDRIGRGRTGWDGVAQDGTEWSRVGKGSTVVGRSATGGGGRRFLGQLWDSCELLWDDCGMAVGRKGREWMMRKGIQRVGRIVG